ncbi:hypothetical protein SAMN05216553_105169 [Lentzea fradiae]|uniref:Glycosyl transferase family 2 n=1 Tax=Lentzea fradiae TaxID=200378 RepID=A0A1G7R7E7_9PSEU|nr:hypothetical protein SAMN05216553_105169 [Lentzea fradiae]
MTTTSPFHSEHHHGSHRDLLDSAPETASRAHVDAIIVPTIRGARVLRHAMSLASRLKSVLVVLCSGSDTSAPAVAALAATTGAEVLALDVGCTSARLLPEFKTTTGLERTRLRHHSDLSLKRNLGLLIARLAGWERIAFLDDDIHVPDAFDLERAAALTGDYAGVGLRIGGYPDNSVVCHAYREAGGPQDTFVGGGALVVRTGSTSSFFPKIYNEDWFFLLGGEKLRPTAVTGLALQQPYDPFNLDERARMEEFGDTIAEGLFWLLDEGRPLTDANATYWSRYLDKRRKFIVQTMNMVREAEVDPGRRSKMLGSLTAAWGRSQYIRPQWCSDYVRAWREDRQVWREHLERYGHNCCDGDLDKVRAELGLKHKSTYLLGQPLDHDVADLEAFGAVDVGGRVALDGGMGPYVIPKPGVQPGSSAVAQLHG